MLTVITQHGAGTSANNDLTVRLEYDDKRRVSRLLDPAGSMTQYGYDNSNNLTSVTWPDGNVRRYVYDDTRFKNAITGEIDETGARIATWSYDAKGRASAVTHPDASRNVQFTYGSGATTLSYGQSSLAINFTSTGGTLRPTGTSSNNAARRRTPPYVSPQATTGVQANFESRIVPRGEWLNNSHLNILP